MSAVGTSSPQKLLEACIALLVKDISVKYLKRWKIEKAVTFLSCVAHKFARKFTLNFQTFSVNLRDSIRRLFVDDPCVELDCPIAL